MSGLAEEPRLKRLNAGRPAQKYEPEELNTDTPTKKTNKAAARHPKGRSKQKTKTDEEAKGETFDDRKMDIADLQHLAACLSSLKGSMLEGQTSRIPGFYFLVQM